MKVQPFEILNNHLTKQKPTTSKPNGKKIYIETYGCQMNVGSVIICECR